jgi:hypothetical protein
MMSIVPCATTAPVAAAAMTNATSERETTGIAARIRALCPFRLAALMVEEPGCEKRPNPLTDKHPHQSDKAEEWRRRRRQFY